MKERIAAAVIAAVCWFSAATASAESVTLREAIERSLKSNPLLRAAVLDRSAAEEELSASRSRYLPRVFLESGAELSNTPSRVFMMKLDEGRINPETDFSAESLNHPDARGDFRTALRMEQPLLDLGISSDVDLTGKRAEEAHWNLQASRERTAFRVYLAYLEVRKARAYSEIADQAVADAREHGRLAGVRERDGVGLKSDQLRAATEISEAEQRVISAKNDLVLARMRLNLAVGGRPGEALDIAEVPSLRDPGVEGDLVALAQRTRPDLKVAEKELEAGDISVRRARTAYFPTVYAGAGYQMNDRDIPFGRDNDSWSVGLNLRWELFDGGRRSHDRSKADKKREAAAALLEDRRRDVALQVTESALRRQEAGLRIESARAALKASEEGMRLVSLRFQNGLSSMVDLLDAEAALNRSRANLVEVENAFLAATGELYYQAGVFLKEVMR